jgi:hypothetical protein
VNDLLDETSTFKPGHARSRSDVTQTDWRVILSTMPLQQQQPSLQGSHFSRASFLLPSPSKDEDAQGNMGMFSYLTSTEQLFVCLSYICLRRMLLSNIHIWLCSLFHLLWLFTCLKSVGLLSS